MKPIVYQIFPRYWGDYDGKNVRGGSLDENGCGRFSSIDDKSLEYFKGLGCSHIWYTGVIRHATSCDTNGCIPSHPQIVKGSAGSPYAITDYYDVNPYLADKPGNRMGEFEELVKRTHRHGLKVIIDFVPNHVSRDNVNFGLDDDRSVHWKAENDFYYYPGESLKLPSAFVPTDSFTEPYAEFPARATGNNCFSPCPGINDWYETVKLNYCEFNTPTWDKMYEILKFWASKGVDGFRCDMVELVPSEFFSWVIPQIKKDYPDIVFIAEVYNKENYWKYLNTVGFEWLYDKSGLYDTLHDIVWYNVHESEMPAELWRSTRRITGNWQFLGDLQDNMLNFLENHDEQRLACDDFAASAEKGYAALAVSLLLNKAPFMLYCGQETGERGEYSEGFSGQDGRSTIFDWWKNDSYSRLWKHIHCGKGLQDREIRILDRYRSILSSARKNAFSDGKIYDLCFCNLSSSGFDPDRHYAFLRYDSEECYLVFCNFNGHEAEAQLHLPTMNRDVTVSAGPFDFNIIRI